MKIMDDEVRELEQIREMLGLGALGEPDRELIKADGQAAARAILEVFKEIAVQISDTTFREATDQIAKNKKKIEGMRMRMTRLFPLIVPPQDGPLVDAEERLLRLLGKIGTATVPAIAAEIENDKKHPGLLILVQKLAEIGDTAALPLLVRLAKEHQEAKNLAEIRGAEALPIFVQLAGENGKGKLAEIEELTMLPALVRFAWGHYHEEIRDAVTNAIVEIERKGRVQQQIDDRSCKEYLVRQNAPKQQNGQPLAKPPLQQKDKVGGGQKFR